VRIGANIAGGRHIVPVSFSVRDFEVELHCYKL